MMRGFAVAISDNEVGEAVNAAIVKLAEAATEAAESGLATQAEAIGAAARNLAEAFAWISRPGHDH